MIEPFLCGFCWNFSSSNTGRLAFNKSCMAGEINCKLSAFAPFKIAMSLLTCGNNDISAIKAKIKKLQDSKKLLKALVINTKFNGFSVRYRKAVIFINISICK